MYKGVSSTIGNVSVDISCLVNEYRYILDISNYNVYCLFEVTDLNMIQTHLMSLKQTKHLFGEPIILDYVMSFLSSTNNSGEAI